MDRPVITNKLHRSGAADCNVSYNLRQAGINSDKPRCGKRMYGNGHGDTLSVCEGEPLYSCKQKKVDSNESRAPIHVLSSLNGSCVSKDFGDKVMKCNKSSNEACAETFDAYTELRDEFFKHVAPAGIAVSKWDYRSRGKQQDQFVATRGGANTIYTDEDVEAGDTLVYDIPRMDATEWADDNCPDCIVKAGNDPGSQPFGLVEWKKKRGIPPEKRTLVVRSIPRITAQINNHTDPNIKKAYDKFRQGFVRRGQVLGKCVKGGKAGERCDVMLEGTAVGLFNCKDA